MEIISFFINKNTKTRIPCSLHLSLDPALQEQRPIYIYEQHHSARWRHFHNATEYQGKLVLAISILNCRVVWLQGTCAHNCRRCTFISNRMLTQWRAILYVLDGVVFMVWKLVSFLNFETKSNVSLMHLSVQFCRNSNMIGKNLNNFLALFDI